MQPCDDGEVLRHGTVAARGSGSCASCRRYPSAMNRFGTGIALFVGRPASKVAIGGNISKISIELSGGPLSQT